MSAPPPTAVRAARLLGFALPAAALLGGLGAVLRERFEHRITFVPDRYPNGIWDPRPFGLAAADVWFASSDGVELHGWWIPHPRARGCLLVCHGNTGSIAHQVGVLRHLQRLRLDLLAFDYRGYGRSGGRPDEAGLFRDVRAAYDHLVGPLGRPPRSVLLLGHSLGGAVAIDCATDREVAGLIVQSSFTSLREAARSAFPTWPLHRVARNRFRSLDKVRGLTMPKLFIHGDADGTLPVALGRRLYEAAAPPKELYVVPRAGHNDVHRHGGLAYLRRLARFRDRCLARA